MGDWWNPFDDEKGSGFNGGVLTYNPLGATIYGGRKLFEAGKGLVKGALGQNDFNAQSYDVPFAADADNPAYKAWNDRQQWLLQQIDLNGMGDPAKVQPYLDELNAMGSGPSEQELRAGQLQGDRARVLATAAGYDPLISQLQDAAAGKGPSAAQDTLREGNYRANAGAYSMAASGNALPGQRAALLNAAIGQSGMDNQQTARDAAILRSNEITGARSALGGALTGKGGLLMPLYSGDQERELANQQGYYHAQDTNAGISTENTKQAGATSRSIINNAAGVLSGGKAGGGPVAA